LEVTGTLRREGDRVEEDMALVAGDEEEEDEDGKEEEEE
jgi:hypothetical protein